MRLTYLFDSLRGDVRASRGPRVDGDDHSVFELEGQSRGSVVEVDFHVVARLVRGEGLDEKQKKTFLKGVILDDFFIECRFESCCFLYLKRQSGIPQRRVDEGLSDHRILADVGNFVLSRRERVRLGGESQHVRQRHLKFGVFFSCLGI